jgi:hypothetical protein
VQPQSLATQFEKLLPLATEWAVEQQDRIVRDGVPLSIRELADALKVGVKDPERVRLLKVDIIPSPTHPALQAAYQVANFVPTAPRGLTIHYGVFVRADYWRDRALIVHELVHTAQYERMGGINPFFRQYLFECATVGYNKSAMETEAVNTAARVLKSEELMEI